MGHGILVSSSRIASASRKSPTVASLLVSSTMMAVARLSKTEFLGALSLIVICGIHCSSSNGGADDDTDNTGDTDTQSDSTTDIQPPSWSISMVEDADVGLLAKVAIASDGSPALAYFANTAYADGICDEIEVDPPAKMRQELRYAQRQGADENASWIAESVDTPVVSLAPNGLALAFDGQNQPNIAYTSGEPQDQYCGANNAVLATRGGTGWTFETAGS